MTIFTLLLYVAIAAVILTAATAFLYKGQKNWLMTYLQHFCGALFIFSGYVKAVDPMGTAFKMEQYFQEFYYTFSETAMSFIAPIFPWMSDHSISISVGMIVFEIVLGIMLILGSRAKLTSWMFFLLVAFFTVLTGFTYLTGYVPSGTNFFEFSKWGEWVETNMRVTDCGCFGDFLKLKPKISFYKDVFLLFPSVYFLFRHKDMHQLFTSKVRAGLITLTTVGFFIFCLRNFVWNEPVIDFRPFHAGADVRNEKIYEMEQADLANKVTAYQLTNKSTSETVTLPIEQYLSEYKNYPKEEWELKQVKGNPPFETSKISDFEVSDLEGNSVTEEILDHPGYSFMVVSYKLKTLENTKVSTVTVQDTVFTIDTVLVEGTNTTEIVKNIASVNTREIKKEETLFQDDFVKKFTETVNPIAEAAEKAGVKVFGVTAPNSPEVIDDFRHATQSAYPFYTADDLLIKTIQRSNPGLVLWKDGKIVQKWHINKMPDFATIKAAYMP